MNNKGFTLVELITVIVIISIISLISFQSISKKVNNSKQKLYETQVFNLQEAAKKYILENPKVMDENHLNTVCVSIETLQDKKYIEKGVIKNPLTKTVMDGKIEVSYDEDNNQYKYLYNEACTDLIVVPAYKHILANTTAKVVGTTNGLYETTDSYVYRGMNPNNYIKLNNKIFRIVSIDKETGMLKLINFDSNQVIWTSNLLTNINEELNVSTSAYNYLADYVNKNSKWNIGKIDKLESYDVVKSIEKETQDYKTIGFLNVSEYIDASTNRTCYKTNTCNSYLNNNTNYWLINKTTSDYIWIINSSGEIKNINPTNQLYNAYIVVSLNINKQISTGDGTLANPFILN